jgi:mevalonate kinase
MSTPEKSYPGKIMLFGEYSIICGSKALVIPYDKVSGRWEFYADVTSIPASIKGSQNELRKLIGYLNCTTSISDIIDLQSFVEDVESGLYFNSTIPQQYGVGSSGALVAALYDRYKRNNDDNLEQLKSNLSLIESAFHGNSSGIDPLCCYLNEAVYINQKDDPIPKKLSNTNEISVFLVNTHISSSTEPLVSHFKAMLHHYSFYKKLSQSYIPTINRAIENLLAQRFNELMNQIASISAFQSEAFSRMIPESYKFLFQGDKNKPFEVKLCGSGGGGYLLGFTQHPEETKTALIGHNLDFVFL